MCEQLAQGCCLKAQNLTITPPGHTYRATTLSTFYYPLLFICCPMHKTGNVFFSDRAYKPMRHMEFVDHRVATLLKKSLLKSWSQKPSG